jgi:hypothetical protein
MRRRRRGSIMGAALMGSGSFMGSVLNVLSRTRTFRRKNHYGLISRYFADVPRRAADYSSRRGRGVLMRRRAIAALLAPLSMAGCANLSVERYEKSAQVGKRRRGPLHRQMKLLGSRKVFGSGRAQLLIESWLLPSTKAAFRWNRSAHNIHW